MPPIGPTTKPHVVSRVVLRRFCGASGEMTRFDIAHRSLRPVGPRGMGYTTRLRPTDPSAFEAIWRAVEDKLPAVFDAVDAGTALDDPSTIQVLKGCLAMHMARTNDLAVVHDLSFQAWSAQNLGALAADPRTARSFEEHHYGIIPAGREALALEAQAIVDRSIAGVESSSFRAERMAELYADAQHRIAARWHRDRRRRRGGAPHLRQPRPGADALTIPVSGRWAVSPGARQPRCSCRLGVAMSWPSARPAVISTSSAAK